MALVLGMSSILRITKCYFGKDCPVFSSLFTKALSIMISNLSISGSRRLINYKKMVLPVALNYMSKRISGKILTRHELLYCCTLIGSYECCHMITISNYFGAVHFGNKRSLQKTSNNYMASAMYACHIVMENPTIIDSIMEYGKKTQPRSLIISEPEKGRFNISHNLGCPFVQRYRISSYKIRKIVENHMVTKEAIDAIKCELADEFCADNKVFLKEMADLTDAQLFLICIKLRYKKTKKPMSSEYIINEYLSRNNSVPPYGELLLENIPHMCFTSRGYVRTIIDRFYNAIYNCDTYGISETM